MKKIILLFTSILTLGILLFSIQTNVTADTISTDNLRPPITTYVHVPSDPGNVYSKWHYKYTAAPYDFYYNPYLGTWKMVQVTSSQDHLVRTIFDGWAKYGPWVPRVYK